MVGATFVSWTTSRALDSLTRELQISKRVRPQKSWAGIVREALACSHGGGSISEGKAGVWKAQCRSSESAWRSNYCAAPSSVQLFSAIQATPLRRSRWYLTTSKVVCCAAPTLIDKEGEAPIVEGLEDVPKATLDRVIRQNFTTRWYEVGADGKARMETIANYMQEIGANHVNTLYVSDDGLASSPLMKKHRLVWIITKMHIEMDLYPSWGDVVGVESWTEPVGKNGGRRDWTFSNSCSGVELGRGTSMWVMMNLDTRRLARIPEDVRNEYASFCPEVPRYAVPDMAVVNQRLPQGAGTPARTVKDLQARYCDLDLHRHINNVTYTTWFLEAVDRHLRETHDLCGLTIEFRQECTGEDLVESALYVEDAPAAENGSGKPVGGERTFLHSLCLQNSRKELARARTRWRPKRDGKEL